MSTVQIVEHNLQSRRVSPIRKAIIFMQNCETINITKYVAGMTQLDQLNFPVRWPVESLS